MIIKISFMAVMIKIIGSAVQHSIFEWLTNQCLVKVMEAGWVITMRVDTYICKTMMTVGNGYCFLICFGCWSMMLLLHVIDPESSCVCRYPHTYLDQWLAAMTMKLLLYLLWSSLSISILRWSAKANDFSYIEWSCIMTYWFLKISMGLFECTIMIVQ